MNTLEPHINGITRVTLSTLRTIKDDCQYAKDSAPIDSPRWKRSLGVAEQFGKVFAKYLLDTEKQTDAKQNWLRMIDEIGEELGFGKRILDPLEYGVVSSYAERVRRLKGIDDPNVPEVINEGLLKLNSAVFSLNDLQNPGLLIISPLATDYSLICLVYAFLEKFRPDGHFMLRPIIVSSRWNHRRLVAIPDRNDPVYNDVKEVRVFVEHNTTWETMRTAEEAAEIFASGKNGSL